ncbi:MAG: hypothetical protein QG591_10, partial [Planctomycetota bacterium]|nr:hypothetical protein [Planctomycetota bacterium]
MKIVIFLFLMLMTCSTLFAYEVKVTKLTDEKFDPLPKEREVFQWGLIEGYNKDRYSQYSPEGKQIATITLVFEFDVIGKNYGAVNEIAKKEAAKLGANKIYCASGTEKKATGQITSMTYCCIRDVNLFLMDSDYRPKQYTENKFEVQKDGKVIYDKATGLMWQQTGSEKYMKYDEA